MRTLAATSKHSLEALDISFCRRVASAVLCCAAPGRGLLLRLMPAR